MTETRQRRSLFGPVLVLGAATLWALLGLWSRGLADRGISPATIAWWRAGGGGLCFGLHAAATRRSLTVDRALRAPLAAFAVVGVSVFYLSVPQAVDAGGVTLAFLLLYTAPLWVLAWTVLAERRVPSGPTVAVVGGGLTGIVLVVGAGGEGVAITARSVGWGLVAGVSYASYYVLGRSLFARHGAIATYAVVLPLGAVPLGVAAGGQLPHGSQWWWACALVVVSTYVPYQLLAAGLARTEATRAVVVATIEPVLAAAIGWAVYSERLSGIALVGAAVVVVAATAASIIRT